MHSVFSALVNSEAAAAFYASARMFCTVFCMSDFDYIQSLKSFSLYRFEYISWKSVVLFSLDLIVDLMSLYGSVENVTLVSESESESLESPVEQARSKSCFRKDLCGGLQSPPR